MDGIQGDMMVEIEYKEIHEFEKDDLKDLFCLLVVFRSFSG